MNNQKFDTICFGGEDWWYHNRGHTDFQLMRRFVKYGTVLYVNSIVMKKHTLGPGQHLYKKIIRKIKSIFTGLKKTDAGFWAYSPFCLPFHHWHWARIINNFMMSLQLFIVKRKLAINNPIIWVVCPTACDIALKLKKAKLVYQRTDQYEDTPDVDRKLICYYDNKLKTLADITIYVNRSLYNKETGQCHKAYFLDHGVDYDMFALAEKEAYIPDDISTIKRNIIGYFGGIADHKVDIELIKKITKLLPEMSFVFIGETSINENGINDIKNIYFLGKKEYEQIPSYGKCFDVAILPWRINNWTKAANPIKLKEYLALGKPIVCTPSFSEVDFYRDVIYCAKNPEEFAETIRKALQENSDELVQLRRNKVKSSTWDNKAEDIIQVLFA